MSAIIISALIGVGLFLILSASLKLPSLRERRNIGRLGKPKEGFSFDKKLVIPVAEKFAKLTRMNPDKKERLQNSLDFAGMELSAEVYTVRAFVITAYILLLGLIAFLLHIYIAAAGAVISAVIVYFKVKNEVNDLLKKKRAAISGELPRFMRTVTQSLLFDSNLLAIIDKYRLVAGPALRPELDRLVLNMQTGNQGEALTAFEKRIGIDYLTAFVSGLVSQNRGVDQKEFLRSVERDMKKMSLERLKTESFKKPDKLKAMQLLYIGSMLLVWIAALGLQAYHGLDIFTK